MSNYKLDASSSYPDDSNMKNFVSELMSCGFEIEKKPIERFKRKTFEYFVKNIDSMLDLEKISKITGHSLVFMPKGCYDINKDYGCIEIYDDYRE